MEREIVGTDQHLADVRSEIREEAALLARCVCVCVYGERERERERERCAGSV
jgi:hypothetical protein